MVRKNDTIPLETLKNEEGMVVEIPFSRRRVLDIMSRIPQSTYPFFREFVQEAVEVYLSMLDVQENVRGRLECLEQGTED